MVAFFCLQAAFEHPKEKSAQTFTCTPFGSSTGPVTFGNVSGLNMPFYGFTT